MCPDQESNPPPPGIHKGRHSNKWATLARIRLIMILASQAYSPQTWLQRIIPEKSSYRFFKQYFFFFTGLMISGITVAAFALGLKMFPLAMTRIATSTVFLVVISVVNIHESEGVTAAQSWAMDGHQALPGSVGQDLGSATPVLEFSYEKNSEPRTQSLRGSLSRKSQRL